MPVYVYECSKCGYQKEEIESINTTSVERPCEAPVEPKCDGSMRRVPSAITFKFNCPMPTAPSRYHKK